MADLLYHAILTTVGAAKYNASQLPGGEPFTLTAMGIDDGGGTAITPDPEQTALINEVYKAELNYGGVDPVDPTKLLNTLIIPADASETGFVCRGFGIYDADDDLVIVGNMPMVEKPGTGSGAIRPQKINVRLTITGNANVQMVVDHSELYPSQEYVNAKVQEAILMLESSININNWKHLVVNNDWTAAIQAAHDSNYSSIYFDAAQEYVVTDTLLLSKPKRFFGLRRPYPVIRWKPEDRPNGGNMFQTVGDVSGIWAEGIRFLGNRPYQTTNSVTGQDFAAFHMRSGSMQNITFHNCRFQDFGTPDGLAGAGILLGSRTGTGKIIDNVRITDCDYTNIRNVPGVYINGEGTFHERVENIIVTGNTFRNDVGISARQNAIYILGRGVGLPAMNVTVRKNIFRFSDSIDCAIELNFVHRFELLGNDLQVHGAANVTGILIRDDCQHGVIERNFLFNYGSGNKVADGTSAITFVRNGGGDQASIAVLNNHIYNYHKSIIVTTGSRDIDIFSNDIEGLNTNDPIASAISVAAADNINVYSNNISNAMYAMDYFSGVDVKFHHNNLRTVGDGTYGAIMEAQGTPPAQGLQIYENEVILRGATPWFVHVGPATPDRNRIANNRISDTSKPQVNPYFAHLWGTIVNGVDTSRATASTSSAVVKNAEDVLNLIHSSPSQVIGIARICQAVMSATADITGGGHPVGILGNCSIMAGAGNSPQAIGMEGRVDVYAGYTKTLGTIKPVMSLANLMGGTHPLVSMTSNEVAVSTNVVVSELRGNDFVMIQQNGQIGKLVGTHFPNLSGLNNVAEKWAFEGLDITAPIYNKGVICSGSYGYSTPTAGSTVTIPPMIGDFQLLGASTLATMTLNFPPASATVDGQEITIGSQMAITALTLNTPAGTTMLNKPTSVAAGGVIRYKFYKNVGYWVRR